MTIRQRSLVIIGVSVAGLILVVYAVSAEILLGRFASLEADRLRAHVEQALNALSDDIAALNSTTRDYSAWDDTYAFVEDGNPEYIELNLSGAALENLNVDFVVVIHRSGRIVYATAFDAEHQQEVPIPPGLLAYLADCGACPLLTHPDTESSMSGVLLLPGGPVLVASRPIITSQYTGPIRGSLIMGRALGLAETRRLAEIIGVSLSVYPVDDPRLPSDFQIARTALADEAQTDSVIRPLNGEVAAGYALLKDIHDAPALLLRLDEPREIYAQGQDSLHYFLGALLIVGTIFGGAIYIFVDRDRALASRLARQESDERYHAVIEQASEGIYFFDIHTRRVLEANAAFRDMLGYTADETPQLTVEDFVVGDRRRTERKATVERRRLNEQLYRRKDSTLVNVEITANRLASRDRKVLCVVVRDVTDRKQAERALRESEARYRTLVEQIPAITYRDVEDPASPTGYRSLYLSPQFETLLGYPLDEDKADLELWYRIIHPDDRARVLAEDIRHFTTGEPSSQEYRVIARDGRVLWFRDECMQLTDETDQQRLTQGILLDITELKQRERELEAITAVSTALRAAQTRAEMLPIILDQLLDLLKVEGAALALRDPITGEAVIELARGVWAHHTGLRLPPDEEISGRIIVVSQPYVNNEVRGDLFSTLSDPVNGAHAVAGAPLIVQRQTIGALWIGRGQTGRSALYAELTSDELRLLSAIADMAANAIHRVTLHEQTERRLRHVQALHANDRAITASLDLRLTLTVLLEQVTAQLGVDAAAVLLLHAPTQTLEYAAGRGFRAPAIQHTRRRLGEGHAGRAALEMRIISLPNNGQSQEPFERAALMTGEFFTAYFAVPLIAKGQVKGVLEIFHRRPLVPDTEWLDFLDAVAGQAAIAIDNATLFTDLQRSNTELALAYDTTLEGWSRALDLRDKETEGHTQRVTEMTLRLAGAMGAFSEAQLVHLRRGALLHDIGKMGIPDSILLKPGPLTAEEWVVMRRHPSYAYDMLSPIAFLRPALDIPLCHHEKWDGSGYPRGLKGGDIPLAARLFAVVDVWDALGSDRPYRQGWPEDKVREHIRALAGTHFDPQVLEAFLRLLDESNG